MDHGHLRLGRLLRHQQDLRPLTEEEHRQVDEAVERVKLAVAQIAPKGGVQVDWQTGEGFEGIMAGGLLQGGPVFPYPFVGREHGPELVNFPIIKPLIMKECPRCHQNVPADMMGLHVCITTAEAGRWFDRELELTLKLPESTVEPEREFTCQVCGWQGPATAYDAHRCR